MGLHLFDQLARWIASLAQFLFWPFGHTLVTSGIGLANGSAASGNNGPQTTVGLSTGDIIAIVGDVLVFLGFVVAVGSYLLAQHNANQQRRRSTLNLLRGVQASVKPWADRFFDKSYKGHAYGHQEPWAVTTNPVGRWYWQYNQLAMTPVESLVQPPGDSWPLARQTVEAAGAALHHMTVFNQLVLQQNLFFTLQASNTWPQMKSCHATLGRPRRT